MNRLAARAVELAPCPAMQLDHGGKRAFTLRRVDARQQFHVVVLQINHVLNLDVIQLLIHIPHS